MIISPKRANFVKSIDILNDFDKDLTQTSQKTNETELEELNEKSCYHLSIKNSSQNQLLNYF